VVATVRAIGRTLQSAGLDWHDLAVAISDPPKPRVVFVERDAAPAAGGEPETWQEIAKWCRAHDRGQLKQHERQFVNDMAARLVCGGEPTERQASWLRALYARLKRASS
jgi:hypothetical protein